MCWCLSAPMPRPRPPAEQSCAELCWAEECVSCCCHSHRCCCHCCCPIVWLTWPGLCFNDSKHLHDNLSKQSKSEQTDGKIIDKGREGDKLGRNGEHAGNVMFDLSDLLFICWFTARQVVRYFRHHYLSFGKYFNTARHGTRLWKHFIAQPAHLVFLSPQHIISQRPPASWQLATPSWTMGKLSSSCAFLFACLCICLPGNYYPYQWHKSPFN